MNDVPEALRKTTMSKFTLRVGRMISGSKTAPKGHVCVFNANICTKGGKFWFGDIDLTDDAEQLKLLAAEKGEDIYVLREMDARFTNEAKPLLENAIAIVTPGGHIGILQS